MGVNLSTFNDVLKYIFKIVYNVILIIIDIYQSKVTSFLLFNYCIKKGNKQKQVS